MGFSASDLAALDQLKLIGVRSGRAHRHTGVWVVVVERRVFVRSWNDKPTGWFRAFRAEPHGTIRFGSSGARETPIRARAVRSARLLAAVSAAYALKYDTPASEKWVRGFADAKRAGHTLELLPAKAKTS